MRFLVFLIVAGVLALGGWLMYQRFLAPEGVQGCKRVAERCALEPDEIAACTRAIADVRDEAGKAAAERLSDCLTYAQSCAEAVGCAQSAGQSVTAGSVFELVDALRRGRQP